MFAGAKWAAIRIISEGRGVRDGEWPRSKVNNSKRNNSQQSEPLLCFAITHKVWCPQKTSFPCSFLFSMAKDILVSHSLSLAHSFFFSFLHFFTPFSTYPSLPSFLRYSFFFPSIHITLTLILPSLTLSLSQSIQYHLNLYPFLLDLYPFHLPFHQQTLTTLT